MWYYNIHIQKNINVIVYCSLFLRFCSFIDLCWIKGMISKFIYDRNQWIKGPWTEEPDLCGWITDPAPYAAVIRRNNFGNWVGCVGLDSEHNLFGVESISDQLKYVEVHGGITLAGNFPDHDLLFSPPLHRWYIGFETMHKEDLCPHFETEAMRQAKEKERGPKKVKVTYRDLEFVIKETNSLATQLTAWDARVLNDLQF